MECGDNCQSRDPVNLTINDGEYTEQLSFFKFENGEVNSGNTQIHQYTRDEFIGQMTHEQRGGGSDGAEKLSYRKTSPLNWYPTAITSFKLQCYSSAICLQSGELRIYVK